MTNETQKVSVIIPCYNQAQYLPDALTSVLNQSYQYWECIIVNDGSLDNTEEVAKEWCERDERFKYFIKTNGGLSVARNFGIKHSTGTYILPLDSDDKIGLKYLEEAVEVLIGNPGIGIVYCNVEYFGDKKGLCNLPEFSIHKMLSRNLIICSALYRKSDYLSTNGYNPNMIYGWEDWDFWLSLIEIGKGVFKLSDVHFYYRIKNKSMLNELHQDPNKQAYSLKTIYQNHFEFYLEKTGNPIKLYSDLNKILSSKDYMIGRFVVYPFRRIKKIFKK